MSDAAITLVENGRSCSTIVTAADSGPQVAVAVEDMARVVAEMSGAAIPVVADGSKRKAGPEIHVGATSFAEGSGLVPTGLPVNGYRIATAEEAGEARLVIVGPTYQGICHGIYDVLANELGVCWGMPAPIFEDIPRRLTVELPAIDRTEQPAFGFRVWSGNDPAWIRRNRVDDGSRQLPYYGHGHNLHNVITPDEHGDHPEYFALIDGERQIPEKRDGSGPQPCLTHPDVIRITIEKVREFFDQNPDVSTYSLCPCDSARFCRCPKCSELDDITPEYRGRRMNSESYFYYVDAVARELLKTHPDRCLGVYAYWTTETLPTRTGRLTENVVVYLTQDSSQYYDPAYEKRDHEILENWSKAAHHLAVYCYYGLGWFPPRVYPSVAARTIPYLPTVGVKGFYCETYPYWAHIGAQLYLATKVLWDTDTDPKAALDDWYERMFAEAAPEMRDYYETVERGWMERTREGKWFLGLDWLCEQLNEWPSEARERSWEKINVAYDAARDDKTRRRVNYVRTGHRLAYLLSKTLEEAHGLAQGADGLQATLGTMFDRVEEALAIYSKSIETDLTYGAAYYRGPRGQIQIDWWMAYMATLIQDAVEGDSWLSDDLDGNDTFRKMVDAIGKEDVPRRVKEAREIHGRPARDL